MVNRVIEGNSHKPNKLLHREEYPAVYASFDNIMPSETMIWHQFDDKRLSIIIDEVITIDSTYMEKIFGNNTAGTAYRGYSRVQRGSYMKDTMRYTTVKGEYFGIKKDFVFMQVKYSPSMRSEWEAINSVNAQSVDSDGDVSSDGTALLEPLGMNFSEAVKQFFQDVDGKRKRGSYFL